jgi:hypothetical protein
MRIDTPSPASSRSTYLGEEVITITHRTVRFGKTVYQTKNIAAFSEGKVPIGQIPWALIGFAMAAAMLAFISSGVLYSWDRSMSELFSGTSTLIMLCAIAGGIWNLVKPKHYGFLLILNSGDTKLFTTKDTLGLKQVVSTIYDFIESDKDATYQITVNNSKIRGNFIQGHVGGNVNS